MEIDEYRLEFLQELRNDAIVDGNDVEDQFVKAKIQELEEIGELIDPIAFSCEMRGSGNRAIAFDAYGYDEADSSFVLLISDFQNTKTIATVCLEPWLSFLGILGIFHPFQDVFIGQAVAFGNVARVALSVWLGAGDAEGAFALALNACDKGVNGNATVCKRTAVDVVDLGGKLV